MAFIPNTKLVVTEVLLLKLFLPAVAIRWPTRAEKCFESGDVVLLFDIYREHAINTRAGQGLLRFPNFGKRTLREIDHILIDLGLPSLDFAKEVSIYFGELVPIGRDHYTTGILLLFRRLLSDEMKGRKAAKLVDRYCDEPLRLLELG